MRYVIIGTDDWAVFARGEDGHLYSVIVEIWPEWWDAPNSGRADYRSDEWAEDWRYILRLVDMRNRRGEVTWLREDSDDPGMTDQEFRQKTLEHLKYPRGLDKLSEG